MKKSLLRRAIGLGVTAVAALGFVAAPAMPAQATTLSGCHSDGKHYEVCFTDPLHDKGTVIEDRLGQLVDSAHDGDTIRFAWYMWTRTALAKKVVAAKNRGVHVSLVLDDKVKGSAAYDTLHAGKVPITWCTTGKGSCLSTHINHNKFFLFDLGGQKSVVQTSFNDTGVQLKLYNNMVRVIGDTKLYDYYLAYWNRLHDHSWHGWTSDDDRHGAGSLGTKAYVFPRSSGDPVLGVLNNVTDCRSGDATIYVAESKFTTARASIKHRLAYLHDKKHCTVKVVTQQAADENWVQAPTSDGYNLPNTAVRHLKLHHKFILIDAKYAGHWQRMVFTGSHNLNENSLRHNDETLLRVHNAFVYDQFRRHFLGIYGIAAGA